MKKDKRKTTKLPIKTRDYLLVKLINGATKAGVHKDKKKEQSKRACRNKVKDGLENV